ncbi:carboxymethylenebutenolidase homolog [Glandiceps talaboti]
MSMNVLNNPVNTMASKPRLILAVGVIIVAVVLAILLTLFFTVWNDNQSSPSRPCDPGDTRDDYVADGTDVVINANLSAYLVEPVGSCLGAVIVIHDIYGYEVGSTRLIADELATHGYTAIMPDLFRGNPWNGGSWGQYAMWNMSHPQERVDQDVEASVEYLQSVKGLENVGIIGFCWGGRQVVLASNSQSTQIQAGVGFYGVLITAEQATDMSFPTMLIFAQNDTIQSLDGVYLIEEALKGVNRMLDSVTADDSGMGGPPAYVKVFDDADHAFVHRANRSDPVAAALAEEAKQDMYTWLERYLPLENDNMQET